MSSFNMVYLVRGRWLTMRTASCWWLAVLSAIGVAAAEAVSLSGTVRDTLAVPVAGALVVVVSEADPTVRQTATTEADGRYQLSVATSVLGASGSVPGTVALYRNWPNPFNPSTRLGYRLDADAQISLAVVNLLGQQVRLLDRGFRSAGAYQLVWDGLDDAGRPLAAGVYLYCLRAGDRVLTGKMAMLDGAVALTGTGAGGRGDGVVAKPLAAVYRLEVSAPGIRAHRQEHLALIEGQVVDVIVSRVGNAEILEALPPPSSPAAVAAVFEAMGVRVADDPSATAGLAPAHLRVIAALQSLGAGLTVAEIAAELTAQGVLFNGAPPVAAEMAIILTALVEAAYQAPESPLALLPQYLVSYPDGTLPESPPAISANTRFAPTRAALVLLAVQVAAQLPSADLPRAAGKPVQGLADQIAAAWLDLPLSSGAHGEDLAALTGTYAGGVLGLAIGIRACGAVTLTASIGPVAIPYLVKGTTVGRSGLGSRAAMSLYRWVRGAIGEVVSSDEAQTVILAEEGLTVGGEVLVPAGPAVGPVLPGTTGEVRTFALPNGVTMEFVWIGPATFTMGPPSSALRLELEQPGDEGPQHQVTLTQGFWLGRYELTKGQWEGVMGTRPWGWQRQVEESAANPAGYISWDDAQGLVQALNQATGDSLYRLPTEAEWEYACRAGTTTAWSFGSDEAQLGQYAWYWANAFDPGLTWAQPGGQKLANPWGLYDMHGNVQELVQDWYGSYGSAWAVDPPGPSTGTSRVVRGGSFSSYARYTRSAYRLYVTPASRGSSVGVRLLRTAGDLAGGSTGTPDLSASVTRISVGRDRQDTPLELRHAGTGALIWTVRETESWLEVSSPQGDTGGDGAFSGTGAVALTVTTDGMALADGVYEGTIQIRSNGGDLDIPVQMTIGASGGHTPGRVTTFPLPNGATMDFVWIPAGTFTMGSPASEPGRHSDEGPQRQVTITRGFCLGTCEVTQGQWQAVMQSTPWSGQRYVQASATNPAVFISWDDVQGLVQALNQAAGDSLYRLPTEAEWEYACRAGTTTRWSSGDSESQLGQYAWHDANAWAVGKQYGQPVGTKLPNPWGLFDMHGNVWEWVQDWKGPYGRAAAVDPPGPPNAYFRAIRGGSLGIDALGSRSACRGSSVSINRGYSIGARLVRVR